MSDLKPLFSGLVPLWEDDEKVELARFLRSKAGAKLDGSLRVMAIQYNEDAAFAADPVACGRAQGVAAVIGRFAEWHQSFSAPVAAKPETEPVPPEVAAGLSQYTP